jgi:hypothetical protein
MTIANFNKGNIYDIRGKYDSAVIEYDTVIIKFKACKVYYNRGIISGSRKFKGSRQRQGGILLNQHDRLQAENKQDKAADKVTQSSPK